jgi:hypothetical protein
VRLRPHPLTVDQRKRKVHFTLRPSRLLLFSVLEIHDRDQGVPACGHKTRPQGGSSGEGKWEHQVLYGCRLEGSRGTEARVRAHPDHGPGGQGDGHGGVYHAWNVDPGAGQAFEGSVSGEGSVS